ncbi:MAG: Gfo/Idh/MocA family oxidoreductase, partial [Pseudomonadota bacterium]
LAEAHGPDTIGKPLDYTTDVDAAISDERCDIFFDASGTLQRIGFLEKAIANGKAVYCEKPTATVISEALKIAKTAEDAGVKNGVVQDKLWLPGIRRLRALIEQDFFGKILSVRGEFGYWVFTGQYEDQPPQRPSWNYREEDGGGIMIDMFCHWQYVLEGLFADTVGPVKSLVSHANVDIAERVDESGKPYKATADDSAYAIFLMGDGVPAQFNSSWCTRVRRDDLLTIQIDGEKGSAVAGLRECWIQPLAATPKPVWNPDIPQPINFFDGWEQLPDQTTYDNAFKIQWELFLRHVALDEPFPWTLRKGAAGVQLAELGMKSWRERQWVEVGTL